MTKETIVQVMSYNLTVLPFELGRKTQTDRVKWSTDTTHICHDNDYLMRPFHRLLRSPHSDVEKVLKSRCLSGTCVERCGVLPRAHEWQLAQWFCTSGDIMGL